MPNLVWTCGCYGGWAVMWPSFPATACPACGDRARWRQPSAGDPPELLVALTRLLVNWVNIRAEAVKYTGYRHQPIPAPTPERVPEARPVVAEVLPQARVLPQATPPSVEEEDPTSIRYRMMELD